MWRTNKIKIRIISIFIISIRVEKIIYTDFVRRAFDSIFTHIYIYIYINDQVCAAINLLLPSFETFNPN